MPVVLAVDDAGNAANQLPRIARLGAPPEAQQITDAYPTPFKSVSQPQRDGRDAGLTGGNLAKGFLTRFITFQ